jgi:hypothetical protein
LGHRSGNLLAMTRPTQNITSGGAILFDGLKAVCWYIAMNSDITASRVTNIAPGQLYSFVFIQNAAGNHRMTWPLNCINAAAINPKPNSTTVQHFVGLTGGTLYANIPPTGSVT